MTALKDVPSGQICTQSQQAPACSSQAATTVAGVSVELIAKCARGAFISLRTACDDGTGRWDIARTALAMRLVADEVLPQAERWHRRDLVDALTEAWRAVLRVLEPKACQG